MELVSYNVCIIVIISQTIHVVKHVPLIIRKMTNLSFLLDIHFFAVSCFPCTYTLDDVKGGAVVHLLFSKASFSRHTSSKWRL
jgi:hypothetical protein